MDSRMKEANRQPRTRQRLLCLLVLGMAIVVLASGCRPPSLWNRIWDYCKSHDEIALSEVTDFSWDVAYLDLQYYGRGQDLQEKYQIEGDFKWLETERSARVAFCKDGVLVYDLVLNNSTFQFVSTGDIYTPDSVFTVEWVYYPEYKYSQYKLILTLVEDQQGTEGS